MNERVMQFYVGVLILASVLVGAILAFSFMGTNSMFRGRYTIYVKFSEAPGITRDTPVRKAGIRIGQVRNVQLAESGEGVIVTAEIDRDRRLYQDEKCEVARSLLLGDTSLEFVRMPGAKPDRSLIENGAVIQGEIGPELTSSIAGLQEKAARTLDTLDKAGQNLQSVLTRIDRLMAVNEDKVSRLMDETEVTMKLLQQALASSNDILGDPKLRAQIKQTIGEMPEVLKETRATVEKMGGTFASLQQNMRNMEGLTKPLGERGESLVTEAGESVHKLNLLADNLLKFSQEFNDPQGSLGALLHDKELYQHVTHLAKNLDEMSRDLKPILFNMEVFTDKIARHPGDLGVRGALKKDSGLKELPSGADAEQPQARHWPLTGGGALSVGQGR